MGAVGHYLEQEGIATTQISLIREHTEVIRPPRALWVPFMLGRPLGAPDEPEFQRRVLLAALRLFDAASGPVLEDFPDDAPGGSVSQARDGDACPVNFAKPHVAHSGADGLGQALSQEIAQLEPWHDIARKRRGGTTVGVSARTPAEAGAFVLSLLSNSPLRGDRPAEPLVQSIKQACDDLRAFYEEAAGAQPGALTGTDMQRWFYFGTVMGEVLRALQPICLQSDDESIKAFARLTLIPRVVAQEAARRAYGQAGTVLDDHSGRPV